MSVPPMNHWQRKSCSQARCQKEEGKCDSLLSSLPRGGKPNYLVHCTYEWRIYSTSISLTCHSGFFHNLSDHYQVINSLCLVVANTSFWSNIRTLSSNLFEISPHVQVIPSLGLLCMGYVYMRNGALTSLFSFWIYFYSHPLLTHSLNK